jgi:hypothetical protein
MSDYLNIGCTPYDEPCTQVGSEKYNKLSTLEYKAFANQCKRELIKKFGEDYKCTVRVQSFSHDFGTYKEVVAVYDDEQSMSEALFLEGEADLQNWDEKALEELKLANYSL